jgi:hypothetical protein
VTIYQLSYAASRLLAIYMFVFAVDSLSHLLVMASLRPEMLEMMGVRPLTAAIKPWMGPAASLVVFGVAAWLLWEKADLVARKLSPASEHAVSLPGERRDVMSIGFGFIAIFLGATSLPGLLVALYRWRMITASQFEWIAPDLIQHGMTLAVAGGVAFLAFRRMP